MGRPIPCMLVRGGTSKGVYLDERDLPAKGQARDDLVLSIFGSPDTRQAWSKPKPSWREAAIRCS